MITLRHVSASGRLDEHWAYIVRDGEHFIDAMARFGSVGVQFSVRICSPSRPIIGAHPILRLDETSWRVLPQRFVCELAGAQPFLRPIDCPISAELDELGRGRSLHLTQSPSHVNAALEALDHEQ